MGAGKRRYGLVRPCPKCPFRTDVPPYLRPDRAQEIARSVQSGGEFFCHETTVPDPDDDAEMIENEGSMVCAGSLILMEKARTPNQMMRIAQRIGMYDPERLDLTAPVPGSWSEWQHRFVPEEDEDREPCGIVGPDCEAPAGWATGGGIVENTESYADDECPSCGIPMCGACQMQDGGGMRVCLNCAEEEGIA